MRQFKSFMALLLSLALMITLIPPIEGQANATLNVISPTNGQNNPLEVTYNTIEVVFNPSGISQQDIPRIYYEVTDVTNNRTVTFDNVPPEVIPGSTNRYKFNVELFEGLNRINILYQGAGNQLIRSNSIFVNYTPTTVISELKVEDQLFTNGLFLPESNADANFGLYIEGVARHTERVQVRTNTAPEGQEVNFFGDQFFFYAGTNMDDFTLVGGDNLLIFEAIHTMREYRINRTLVYNDGNSFLYNTNIDSVSNLTLMGDREIIRQPRLQTTGANPSIRIRTGLKLNFNADGNIVHDRITISDQSGATIYNVHITKSGNDYIASFVSGGPTVPSQSDINLGPGVSTDDYVRLSGITFNVPLDDRKADQALQFLFYNTNGTNTNEQSYVQEYTFTLLNPNAPGINEVSVFYNGVENQKLSAGTTNNINYAEFQFRVETTGSPSAVRIYSPEWGNFIESTTSNNGVFTFNMGPNQLSEGLTNLTFVPVSNGDLFDVGARSFAIRYNPTPYIYLANISHGQIFDATQAAAISEFRIVPMNLQLNRNLSGNTQYYPITVTVNENEYTVNGCDNALTASGRFNFRLNGCGRTIDITKEGLYTVVIKLYAEQDMNMSTGRVNQGARPIASYTYEFFVFDNNMPVVSELGIRNTSGFSSIEGADYRYYTQESSVNVDVRVENYHSIELVINTLNANQQQVTYRYTKASPTSAFVCTTCLRPNVNNTIRNNSSNDPLQFWISNIPLYGSGTTTIEVIARSQSEGMSHSRLIEIVREPQLFNLIYPVYSETLGAAQVNGNFSRMRIFAEGADKIIYGRNQEARPISNGYFEFEVTGLKKGTNRINLTIVRGTREDRVTVNLNNVETPVVGAQFKASVSTTRIRAFDRQLELSLPRGTVLQLNDPSAADRRLSPNKEILFGIADPNDGRVDKILHPHITSSGPNRISMPGSRFRMISKLFWIDTGNKNAENDSINVNGIYNGGIYPYEEGYEFFRKSNASHFRDTYVPSNVGELTLSYDPYVVQSAWRYVTVFHYGYNDRGDGTGLYQWRNLGGVVNQRNNTITVPFSAPGYYVVMYLDHSYDDIIGHPWARNHLDTLFAKGIMTNKETNRFSANEAITRGEFAQLLVKAYDIPLDFDGPETFRDVTKRIYHPLYEYKFIETAARKGIIRGSVGLRFEPNSPITREDAAVMIARAANMRLESNVDRAKQRLERNFTDVNNIHDYAVTSVFAVQSAGLIEGKSTVTGLGQQTNYFDPKANLTRAEAAAIVMRVLLREKRIPEL